MGQDETEITWHGSRFFSATAEGDKLSSRTRKCDPS